MLKRFMTFALMLLCLVSMNAQQPQELPLMEQARHGVLPNGLTYFVLHNEEPKGRANFYIAQKVGSTLETPEQLGLAHFLEHMAFNGTKNYPGKTMLEYLQSKGIRFGADINAYTAFDQTVYNINNIPCSDTALMDSVLLVLHDWSGSILLEESEINAERGVIQEEWRSRNDAMTRFQSQLLPAVFEEPQYHQMPIGSMDVVMNFPPEAIRTYYHTWYRPDQQGIIVVGDFDAAEMEKKVVDLFSTIPMPENAPERVYPTVSDNVEPIFFAFEDPEYPASMVMSFIKMDQIPFEFRNTGTAYTVDISKLVLTNLVNNRLNEAAMDPSCKFGQAGIVFSNFLVAKTKDALMLQVLAKDDIVGAYEEALAIVMRAFKTGFTTSELERVTSEILSRTERAYNERNKTDSNALANELIDHFTDNEPAPGIEWEYNTLKAMLPKIPVQAYNEFAAQIPFNQNQVIVVAQPKTATSAPLPAKETMVAALNGAAAAEYEAYVDEAITEPLIAQLPAKGSIVSESANPAFDVTELTLSNGAKVVVKNTDFSADEILFQAYRKGGKQCYAPEQAADVMFAEDALNCSKWGPFDSKTLPKYLAGKRVALSLSINGFTDVLEGSSTVKDLPTLMELIYTSFTNISPDQPAFDATLASIRPMIANMESNPQYKFQSEVSKTMYNGNPMMGQPSLQILDAVNYLQSLDIAKNCLTNAADYTFVFVGNVDMEMLRPLLEQYVASLPSTGKAQEPAVVNPIVMANTDVVNKFDFPMDTPSTIFMLNYGGHELAPDVQNDINNSLMGSILSNIYTETLREEEGGSYSPYAYGSFNFMLDRWGLVSVVQTNSDIQDRMISRAKEEIAKLLNQGATAEQFNKVKGAALNQYDINVRTNSYWNDNLRMLGLGFDLITNNRAAIENLTLEQFNAWMKSLAGKGNVVEVVLTGVPAK